MLELEGRVGEMALALARHAVRIVLPRLLLLYLRLLLRILLRLFSVVKRLDSLPGCHVLGGLNPARPYLNLVRTITSYSLELRGRQVGICAHV